MTPTGLHRDAKALAFVERLSRAAADMQRDDARDNTDVSPIVREQMDIQARAIVAISDDVARLKAALGALAREASK